VVTALDEIGTPEAKNLLKSLIKSEKSDWIKRHIENILNRMEMEERVGGKARVMPPSSANMPSAAGPAEAVAPAPTPPAGTTSKPRKPRRR
jgi:hypothetical protein